MMTHNHRRICFWSLFAAQVVAVLVILATGLPVYWRLLSGRVDVATFNDFLAASLAVCVMQLAYWVAYPLQRNLRFRRNVFVGHVLLWLGELSYFFPHALAALILFDRFKELEEVKFLPARLTVLIAILFAVYCFKHQLETLGEAIIDTEGQSSNNPASSSNEFVDGGLPK